MISVIITAYNVEDFISDSIKSVLEQTYKKRRDYRSLRQAS